MTPIIAFTFNPCVDKSMEIDQLVPDKKMRCTAPRLEPGGGGINVARVVRRLGGKVLAVYPSGGYHGSLLTEMLRVEGVDTYPVPMLTDIRENINIYEKSTGRQYRFIEPGNALTEHSWTRCLDALAALDKGGIVVVSGSLPGGAPPDLWSRIRRLSERKGARLIVDVAGAELWTALLVGFTGGGLRTVSEGGESFQTGSACGLFLIKPSENELAWLAREMRLPERPEETAKCLVSRGYAQVVVVSRGSGGALLVTRDCVRHVPAPEVRQQSTVGAGDSLVGGIVAGLGRKMDLEEAVRFGVACGAATVMNPGTELCHLKDVEKLYAEMRGEAVAVAIK
jgi:6-phosphofructokinase 2